MMKKAIANSLPDLLMVAGAAAISCGAGVLHIAAGLITAGAFALAAGLLLARSGGQ